MGQPTKEEIFNTVKEDIAQCSQYPISSIKDIYELKKGPLRMNNIGFILLRRRLSRFVKKYKPNKTIFKKELTKSGVTIKKVCELVFNKIQ